MANLAQMMPLDLLKAHSVNTLKMVGRANQRVFVEAARRHFFGIEIVPTREGMSAACGAALYARSVFGKKKY